MDRHTRGPGKWSHCLAIWCWLTKRNGASIILMYWHWPNCKKKLIAAFILLWPISIPISLVTIIFRQVPYGFGKEQILILNSPDWHLFSDVSTIRLPTGISSRWMHVPMLLLNLVPIINGDFFHPYRAPGLSVRKSSWSVFRWLIIWNFALATV